MATRERGFINQPAAERGIALVTALMALLLLTGIGLTIALSATTETAVSANYRRTEQAFFAADAGIGVARNAIRTALNQVIQTNAAAAAPNITFPTSVGQPFDDNQLTSLLTNPSLTAANGAPITNALAATSARAAALGNNGNFNVTITLAPLGAPIIGTRPAPINGIAQPPSTITMRYAYTITSTGNNNVAVGNPYRATAQATEQGVINITLNTTVNQNSLSNPTITRAFSSYGTFLSRFPQNSVWAAGTFSGPVHTNQRFRYSSGNVVIFKDAVTQVGPTYDYNSTAYNVSNTNRPGLTFQSTYTVVPEVPLPINVYAQELAVLNSTGLPDSTFTLPQPTTAQLVANLRRANNTPPSTSGGSISNGVYVPSADGVNITGGGIYVKGTVDEMTLSISGSSQVYTIRQGSTTTTITITPPSSNSPGSTRIASGSSSTTFQGVPMDKTDPNNHKPGVSLFVNGSINALHGPAASGGSTPPAIATQTGVTITSTGDITVTGDLKYQQPVLNIDGTLATNGMSATNVLGLFTNSGKITWTPNPTYTSSNYSMTVDAAMVAFNEAALNANPNALTGGWTTDCQSCNSSTVITLRGSRVASKGLPIYGYGKVNRFFDPRFANGAFAPPFFPVTQLQNGTNTTTTFSLALSTSNVSTESNTWQRITN